MCTDKRLNLKLFKRMTFIQQIGYWKPCILHPLPLKKKMSITNLLLLPIPTNYSFTKTPKFLNSMSFTSKIRLRLLPPTFFNFFVSWKKEVREGGNAEKLFQRCFWPLDLNHRRAYGSSLPIPKFNLCISMSKRVPTSTQSLNLTKRRPVAENIIIINW